MGPDNHHVVGLWDLRRPLLPQMKATIPKVWSKGSGFGESVEGIGDTGVTDADSLTLHRPFIHRDLTRQDYHRRSVLDVSLQERG